MYKVEEGLGIVNDHSNDHSGTVFSATGEKDKYVG